MAHIRQTKFGFPRRAPTQRSISEAGRFAEGVHSGVIPALAKPYSPNCDNLVQRDGCAAPRSGLSSFTTGVPQGTIHGGEMLDVFANAVGVAVTEADISILPAITGTWSTLSRLGSVPSATTRDPIDMVYINDLANDVNLGIVVNGIDAPKVFHVKADANTWSNYTDCYSLLSRARTVTAADERLVFANTADRNDSYPTRIVWSARGAPKNFLLASGAGFADPSEMRGQILKIIQDREGFVIFTELEIWRARPRRDNFAFDFFPVTKEVSCPFPRTAKITPIGIVFLASDLDVYAVRGAQVQPLSLDDKPNDTGERVSRIAPFVKEHLGDGDAAWGVYNLNQRRYELHFDTKRALFHDITTGSWWPQTYPFVLKHGFQINDPASYAGAAGTWDEDVGLWNDDTSRWDDQTINRPPIENRDVVVFTDTDAYRPRVDQHTDNGTPFTCEWNSPPVRLGLRNLAEVKGVHIDYQASSTGTLNVAARAKGSVISQTLSLASSDASVGFVGLRLTDRSPALRIAFQSPVRASLSAYDIDVTVRGKANSRF